MRRQNGLMKGTNSGIDWINKFIIKCSTKCRRKIGAHKLTLSLEYPERSIKSLSSRALVSDAIVKPK